MASTASGSAGFWREMVAAGVPHFDSDGTVRTEVCFTEYGRGMRFRSDAGGMALVYLPVSLAGGIELKYIQLRAEVSNMNKEAVKAELIQVSPSGKAAVLASVATDDDPKRRFEGIQIQSRSLGGTVSSEKSPYYIRVTLTRGNPASSPVAYDVSLSTYCDPPDAGDDPVSDRMYCPPGPIPEPPGPEERQA